MATNFLQAMGMPFNPDDPYDSIPAPAPVAPVPVAPPAPELPPIVNAPAAPNMLQTLQNPPPAPPLPAAPAPVGTRPARARSSILDVIGRVSDVLAKVGGAQALYQPTLDARQDREISLGDHDRQVDMDKLRADLTRQQITMGAGALTDADTARLQRAAQGLQAIRQANPNADISSIWPTLAHNMGIPEEQSNMIGEALKTNPDLALGLSGTVGDLGKNLYFGTGPDGKTVAYQIGKDGTPHVLNFGQGITPSEPTKTVNTGGETVVLGQGGNVKKILPNSEKPGAVAERNQRGQIAADRNRTATNIARGNNQTTITVAEMPARAQAGKGEKTGLSADAREALIGLKNIQTGFDDLHRMNALPGDDGGPVDNVLSALGRTGLGQSIGEQAGSAAAQKRLEMSKSINTLQQTLIKALPASATRTKFEQEILRASLPDPAKMSYGTAQSVIRQYQDIFRRAQEAAAAEAKGRAPVRAPARAPVRPRTGGSAGGWSVVGVK